MHSESSPEPQVRAPRRADEKTRERDKIRENLQRMDARCGDPENPMIWRGID